ncbi:MAG: hypothetical protein V3S30_07585 [Thermoanaerobaculia bacterium]
MGQAKIPLSAKIGFTAWLVVWIPACWIYYGPENFLWLCDIANFVIAIGLWLESPLLLSSQAVSVLVIQILWSVDFLGKLTLGSHPIGGTEYMFASSRPLAIRALSLYHLAVPVLLIWAVRRVGYDRRGWKLQSGIAWIILPLSYLVGDSERNLNWLWAPFGVTQTLMQPELFVCVAMVLLPLILFWPTHLILTRLLESSASN